jgi:hypothetical protein
MAPINQASRYVLVESGMLDLYVFINDFGRAAARLDFVKRDTKKTSFGSEVSR